MTKLIAVVAAVVLLAGCGASSEPGAEVTTVVTQTVTVTAEPDMDVVEGEPVEEFEDPDVVDVSADAAGLLAFGDSAELDGAVAVTIGAPVPVEMDPARWDFDPSFDTFLSVPVTVENIGSEPVSTSDLMVDMLSGERAAESFQDSEVGVSGDPYATVLPGKTVTFTSGFAVGAGEELIVEVKLFVGEDAVYYQG